MKNRLSLFLYWGIIKLSRKNKLLRPAIDSLALIFYKIFRGSKYFTFRNKKYKYFYHRYNRTVAGERVVEIPIGYDIVREYAGKKILEVGNVLSHYYKINHDVLDKYEKGKGIINKDVANFRSKRKYDLIISISTMEHVGWSYGEKRDSAKLLKAIDNLTRHLSPKGKIVITFPLYFRKDLSEMIIKDKLHFQNKYYMERVSFLNDWVQVNKKRAIEGHAYDQFFANTNVLFIGIYVNEPGKAS